MPTSTFLHKNAFFAQKTRPKADISLRIRGLANANRYGSETYIMLALSNTSEYVKIGKQLAC